VLARWSRCGALRTLNRKASGRPLPDSVAVRHVVPDGLRSVAIGPSARQFLLANPQPGIHNNNCMTLPRVRTHSGCYNYHVAQWKIERSVINWEIVMISRTLLAAAVTLLALGSVFDNARAGSSTTICWGSFRDGNECSNGCFGIPGCSRNCSTTCASHPYQTYFSCRAPTGGVDNSYLCQQVCGKPLGQGCTVTPGIVLPGNGCGYAWPTVNCE
jgi:hypothetical protein